MKEPLLDAPASEWLVYGDALQEAGDPRGELITLSHAIEEGRADEAIRDAYLKKHARALFGDAASHLAAFRFDWRYCVPRTVTVRLGVADPDRMGPLLASPIARHIRGVTLVGETEARQPLTLEHAMGVLARQRPDACTAFAFVDERAASATELISYDFDPRPNLVKLGPLAPFFAIAEELRLEVADSQQCDFAAIDAPHLRAFTLNSLRFCEYEGTTVMPERLAAAKWPNLERFELRLVETWHARIAAEDAPYVPMYSERMALDPDDVDEEDDAPPMSRYEAEAEDGEASGTDWAALEPLLQQLKACPLRRLALTSFHSSRSLLATLGRIGLAPTLEELDLSDATIFDADLDALMSNAQTFARLKRLVLHRAPLSPKGLDTLSKLGPEIVHSTGSGARYRYVVGYE